MANPSGLAAEVLSAKALGRVVVHTPPPTSSLPEEFAGSAYNASLDQRTPVVKVGQVVPRDQSSFAVDKPAAPKWSPHRLPVIQLEKQK